MPIEGRIWRHVNVGTHGSWLPGDQRGFRNRKHRIHSSGDYKNPPPAGEHRGLLRYNQKRCPTAVFIPLTLRAWIGRAIVQKLIRLGFRALAVSVSGNHFHILVELPIGLPEIKRIIGQCKGVASHAVRDQMPGTIWEAGGNFDPIKDREHQVNVFYYIRDKQGPGAWVWTCRDPVPTDEN